MHADRLLSSISSTGLAWVIALTYCMCIWQMEKCIVYASLSHFSTHYFRDRHEFLLHSRAVPIDDKAITRQSLLPAFQNLV